MARLLQTRFDIGNVQIDRVVESELPLLDPLQIYPDATPEALAAQMDWLAPRFFDPSARLLIVPIQGFIVRARGKIIVVDTCVGDCKRRKRPEFNNQRSGWLERLRGLGVSPEKVDYVVCTHFHVDHVGWNTRLHPFSRGPCRLEHTPGGRQLGAYLSERAIPLYAG
jgi:glyoxylase-like metal-dependent hydrolase (beta-lactamase superfamily II)